MRRARLGLVLLGVAALALTLVTFPGANSPAPQLGAERAAAADCTWQRHSKRVVKRVRRHGKVRRVVRWKRWWTCVPQPASSPVPPAAPTPPAPPEPEPEPEANRLSVKAMEFYFVLSRPKVKAGSLPVELNNQGQDPHNLNILREGEEGEPLQIPETDSKQRNVDTFDLTAGKYRLWCSLPEHEEDGMVATLVVE
ncbi:MAG TPA: plastocyanin/azurin family copper-binding protein [Solirubrobacterales bacterium]